MTASPSTPIPVIAEADLRGFAPHLPRHMRQAFFDAVDAATPATLDNTAVEGLRASVRGIRSNFERIAAHDPNDQPHYRNGVRPWGTGDLHHCIATLLAVEATLTAKTEKAE